MSTYQTYNSGNEIIKILWIINQNKLKKYKKTTRVNLG